MTAVPVSDKGALYIPSLDGMRAFAVLLVLTAHVIGDYYGAIPGAPLGAESRNFVPGSFGVTVFFFLSGYLITTLLRLEHEKTRRVSLRSFYLRRVLRILPPFYFVFFAGILLTELGAFDIELSREALLMQAGHLTNYRVISFGWIANIAPGSWIFWSLAIEEHFYLIFPLVFIGLTRFMSRTSQAYVLVAMCALCLAWRVVLLFAFDATFDRIYLGTDTRFDSILFGCILALVGNPVLDSSRFSIDLWKRVLLPLGIVGILISFMVRNPIFDSTLRYTLQGICLVPVFVVAIRCPDWRPVRPLNWHLSRSIGLISYPLYLVHPLVLALLVNNFGVRSLAGLGVGALVSSILISIGIYLGIEKPIGRLRRRLLTARMQPSSAADASDTRSRPSPDIAAAASDS